MQQSKEKNIFNKYMLGKEKFNKVCNIQIKAAVTCSQQLD